MKVELLKCLYNPKDYKDTGFVEFAFAGRSNAGKSSLINTLYMCNIAKVSKMPGKTKTINLFKIEDKYVIADFPGYGYAKVPIEAMLHWQKLIEHYITHSKRLNTVFILTDIRRGIEDEEIMLMDWLKSLKKNYKIVFTKIDKLNKNELFKAREKYSTLEPFYFSALTKEGRKDILKYIGEKSLLKK